MKELRNQDLKSARLVIIDEAHNFRNTNTQKRNLLIKKIFGCDYTNEIPFNKKKNRKVLLITATPYNNSFSDVINLVELFGEYGDIQINDKIDLWKRKKEILKDAEIINKKIKDGAIVYDIEKNLITIVKFINLFLFFQLL